MEENDNLGYNIFDKEIMDKIFNNSFEYWNIDNTGNISKKRMVYEIEQNRLTEMNWLNHILSKNEKTEEQEFYFVFIEALRRAGYKKLIIDLEDSNNKITAIK
ncbi:MAG: hypothetical protein K5890_03830 [Bacteroidales bacterium]|nr:hypothetical protein [Bacteroidales bacterium]